MRIHIDSDPFDNPAANCFTRGRWPAKWIGHPEPSEKPQVVVYHRAFESSKDQKLRFHLSADERYELYFDGVRIGRGSERGDLNNWFYESHELDLKAGSHQVAVKVWALRDLSPEAQISARAGMILGAEGDMEKELSTGIAAWKLKTLKGISFDEPESYFRRLGGSMNVNAAEIDWKILDGQGDEWLEATVVDDGSGYQRTYHNGDAHLLRPAMLPAMHAPMLKGSRVRHISSHKADADLAYESAHHLSEEVESWQKMIEGEGEVVIAAGQKRRVLIDFENYACVYSKLRTSGGRDAQLQLSWSEGLWCNIPSQNQGQELEAFVKEDRSEIEGKYFYGYGDKYLLDGGRGRVFESLWWRSGRYVELSIETGEEELVISSLEFEESRYPLEHDGEFSCSREDLLEIVPLCERVLQMCSHETFMDCPHYEQLMYVGDTRLQALTTFVMTRDDRLVKKALTMFDSSRQRSGLTTASYPTKYHPTIPPFSLWHIAMLHDHAYWRGDRKLVSELMRGVHGILDIFSAHMREGLLASPPGFNFFDWSTAWTWGIPPEGNDGFSSIFNIQMFWVLQQAAELDAWLGQDEMQARWRRWSDTLRENITERFWNEKRGLFADDPKGEHFSEHAQAMAILSGLVNEDKAQALADKLSSETGLAETTIYYKHYLFDAFVKTGKVNEVLNRLEFWKSLKAKGLYTTLEAPEPCRSDCHAWGAHPLYHYYASVLGIRPNALGFESVVIRPQLGDLEWAKGRMPHPRGWVEVNLKNTGSGTVQGKVTLPKGISGVFLNGAECLELDASGNDQSI